eukprot:749359-Hanusia_phi.AAC.3
MAGEEEIIKSLYLQDRHQIHTLENSLGTADEAPNHPHHCHGWNTLSRDFRSWANQVKIQLSANTGSTSHSLRHS